jgi:hypothetical protein
MLEPILTGTAVQSKNPRMVCQTLPETRPARSVALQIQPGTPLASIYDDTLYHTHPVLAHTTSQAYTEVVVEALK